MSWTLKLDGQVLPDRALIGGKAWSIARMLSLGLTVPPAFVVTTKACTAYQDGGWPEGLDAEIADGLAWLEAQTGRTFDGSTPLLLSVRSGAAISMPGMMDTVLNLGISDQTEAALAAESGEPGFARDTHRRFLELFASIVLRAPAHLEAGADPATWRAQIEAASGQNVPLDPRAQLKAAVRAVFDSWNSRRARKYRQHNSIPDDLGTAVTIQAMVFGNLDEDSGTGVLFSRNPLSGERVPFGEYLPKAQGEDVVSGKFTPLRLEAMHERVRTAHDQLLAASETLEQDSRDMQDIEFTVQKGKLYLLQARSAKRAPEAAVRCAVEMAEEGLIDCAEALARVSREQTLEILRPRLAVDSADTLTAIASGEGACPGVASGVVVTTPDEAEARARAGEAVVLARETTSPDDIHGMIAAKAIITAQGGATSHAAVVSRALGRPCVVGCGGGVMALAGQVVTVDGGGRVYAGTLPMIAPEANDHPWLSKLLAWAEAAGDTRYIAVPEAQDLAVLGTNHG
ncbi:pyruvate, phosphate dikinase [Novosphingobium percolationis]|uniref:pyruvate, phosphate dikinase n=1 Tax=Novosphingobium percolationis TaxID=2871811 RepID=UPI001CD2EC63|nr:pyruvate, phosphate dikinase [Novosphingobium percolationis]